jgi:uncharacterized membrane protein YvbJ
MKKIIVVASICIFVILITIYLSIQHTANMKHIYKQDLSNVSKSESLPEIENNNIIVSTQQSQSITKSNEAHSNKSDNVNNAYNPETDSFIFETESLMSEKQFINDVKNELSYMRRSNLHESILLKMYKVYVKLRGKMIPDDYPILYRYFELNYSVNEAALKLKKDQEANGIFFK